MKESEKEARDKEKGNEPFYAGPWGPLGRPFLSNPTTVARRRTWSYRRSPPPDSGRVASSEFRAVTFSKGEGWPALLKLEEYGGHRIPEYAVALLDAGRLPHPEADKLE